MVNRALVAALMCGGLAACGGGSAPSHLTPAPDVEPADVGVGSPDVSGFEGDVGRADVEGSDSGVLPDVEGSDVEELDTAEHPPEGTSWTFMVYLMADTNLEPYALLDLEEMMAVGSSDDVTIVALIDRAADYTDAPIGGLGDFEDGRIVVVESGTLIEVSQIGEPNMGDPDTLADFVDFAVRNYPADRYALDFWDHGGAWPAFGPDDSHQWDALTLDEIEDGLGRGLERAGLDRLTLVGFDACLMATWEVAGALAPFAEYLLASEQVEPGHGWNYQVLDALVADPTLGPVELGALLIDGFREQAVEQGTDGDLTLSLIDLLALPRLDGAVGDFVAEVTPQLETLGTDLAVAQGQTLVFGQNPEEAYSLHMVDLGDLMANIGATHPELASPGRVHAALNDVVVDSINSTANARATGLTIYWPTRDSLYNADYNGLDMVEPWRSFLADYFAAASSIPSSTYPTFVEPDHLASVRADGAGFIVEGELLAATADYVSSVSLRTGWLTDGTLIYLGEIKGSVDDTGYAYAYWEGGGVVLNQGGTSAWAYATREYDGDLAYAQVPFGYQRPGVEDLQLGVAYVGVDVPTQTILTTTYYLNNDDGTIGELYPETGSLLFPLLQVQEGQDMVWATSSTQGFDPTLEISYTLETLPAGETVSLWLEAADYGGNGDYVVFEGIL